MVLHDWAEIQIIFSSGSGWTLTSAVLWSGPGSLDLSRTDNVEVLGDSSTCEPRTPIWVSAWVTQPWNRFSSGQNMKTSQRSHCPASTFSSCANQDWVFITLATKGTDAVVHRGQVKEAQTSEGEIRDDILPPHYFSYASMIVSGTGTLLKGQKG